MATSWAPEVFVDGKWSRNSLRFRTEEEAERSANALFDRWMLTEGYRATEATEEPNYAIEGNQMVQLPKAAE